MFVRKRLLLTICFSLLSMLCIGCSTSIPLGYQPYIPSIDHIERSQAFGSVTEIVYSSPSGRASFTGEFIGIDGDSIVLADGVRLIAVPYRTISKAYLYLYVPKPGQVGGQMLGTTFLTISNGIFLILTVPATLLVGTIAVAVESDEGYDMSNSPGLNWWNLRRKYARFPGIIPPLLDRKKIRLR